MSTIDTSKLLLDLTKVSGKVQAFAEGVDLNGVHARLAAVPVHAVDAGGADFDVKRVGLEDEDGQPFVRLELERRHDAHYLLGAAQIVGGAVLLAIVAFLSGMQF